MKLFRELHQSGQNVLKTSGLVVCYNFEPFDIKIDLLYLLSLIIETREINLKIVNEWISLIGWRNVVDGPLSFRSLQQRAVYLVCVMC